MTDERRWLACGFGLLLLLAACTSSKNNAASQTGSGGQSASATAGTGATAGMGASAGTSAAGSGGGMSVAGNGSGQAGTNAASGGAGGSTTTGGKAGAQAGAGGSGGQAGTQAATGGSGGGTPDAGSAGAGGKSSSGMLTLTSMAFKDGMMIDAKYRCNGPSPDVQWSGAPDGTMSFALILKDVTPGGFSNGYLHWVIYDIPMSVSMLPENVPAGYAPASPAGAHQAPNYNMTAGFNGPCAPFGTNTYELTLYALDTATLSSLSMSSTGMDAANAIDMHKLASAKITIMSSP